MEAYSLALQTCGYTECGTDLTLDPNFEKAALFEQDGEFSHAARQLPSGEWTSKLGQLHDIEHRQLVDLESAYGKVTLVLKRQRGWYAE